MDVKKLPVGMSSLSEIIEGGFVYVDKTALIMTMLQGKYYFLSRPRRFGKSLLVDTIREMFSGNRELFAGLAAYDTWDFPTNPVISISFARSGITTIADLDQRVKLVLQQNADRLGVVLPDSDNSGDLLEALITIVHQISGKQVVVVVDEYDKPLLDNLTQETAPQIRAGLRDLYSTLKDRGEQLRFVFITGVSKFSKVSIFSGLNNLNDISLNPNFSTLCGYTQSELENSFEQRLVGVNKAAVKDWYYGYSWRGENVYNPFDILLFFSNNNTFGPYWFSTGTPTFLIKLLRRGWYFIPDFENLEVSDSDLEKFDVDSISLETLLFQTGYLSIQSFDDSAGKPYYKLGFPNTEVRTSFNEVVLEKYLLNQSVNTRPVAVALINQDIAGVEENLRNLFASITSDNYRNNPIARYEGYYASVIYAYLSSLGFATIAEDSTNNGRIDLTLQIPSPTSGNIVYIFEFKVDTGESNRALQQITDKNYSAKYRNTDTTIHQIGITFNPETRTIGNFKHTTE